MTMTAVNPVVADDNNLTSSIPEPDISVGEVEWVAGAYNLGDQVIKSSTHKLYQVVADPSTTDDPEDGVNKSPATWVEVSGTNRYRMFDEIIGTQTTSSSDIVVTLDPGVVINAVAGLDIKATAINVTMNDPVAGEVYNMDFNMRDNRAVVDYYEYFFEPIIVRTEFVVTDLPAYPKAETTLTLTNSTGETAIGAYLVGKQIPIGTMQSGSGLTLLNFNTLERDDFGNLRRTTGRRTADRFDYNLKIGAASYPYVRDQMRRLKDVAALWIGTGQQGDGTIVYGYYRDLDIKLDAPQDSVYSASFQVEGLT